MPSPIRIALVEDDRGTRENLVELLRHIPELFCLGAFESASEAEREIPRLLPDVILIDIKLGGGEGIACVERLKRAHPELKFLMLATYDDSDLIFQSLYAGACGYILKRSVATELFKAIEEGHRGGATMSMRIARKVLTHFDQNKSRAGNGRLTTQEEEILKLLTKGLTESRVADRLGIAHWTVLSHLHEIYGKMHLQSYAVANRRNGAAGN